MREGLRGLHCRSIFSGFISSYLVFFSQRGSLSTR